MEKNYIARPATIELIRHGLLTLMKQYKLKEITVTQICMEAKVSRQTFYRHYKTPEDVLEFFMYSMALNYKNSHPPSTNMEKNIKEFYTEEPFPKHLLLLLLENNLFYLLEKACISALPIIINNLDNNIPTTSYYMDYYINYIASTISLVLRIWTKNNFRENKNQLSQITISFFNKDNPQLQKT